MNCPLCEAESEDAFWTDKYREYHRCETCDLIFVPPHQHLNGDAEKSQYDLHNNDPNDERYLEFLNRLAAPVVDYLNTKINDEGSFYQSKQVVGLDFGAGPGPAMHLLFESYDIEIKTYDVFYNKDESVWHQQYDFITASEVFEHLHQPRQVFEQLISHLKSCGVLGVMTKQALDNDAFKRWHYKNDPTHVIFFSQSTFQYLAKRYKLALEIISKDVVIFRKTL